MTVITPKPHRSTGKADPRITKVIMGIDPGTNYTGYGVLEVCGNSTRCVVLGYIELHKIDDAYQKLRRIFERIGALIDEYRPDEVALESPFFGENVQSMLKLGRAQGVAMAAALTRGIPVFEYAPRRIKQAITGSGSASKEQVAGLLKTMLKVEYSLKKLDATDGLAVALCHYFETCSPFALKLAASGGGPTLTKKTKTSGRKGASWEDFMAKNPGREKKSGDRPSSLKKRERQGSPAGGQGSPIGGRCSPADRKPRSRE